jgi:hypothetical protein
MLFAAVILAHPGPAMAQADVDKAMGVVPSPGASKGIRDPGATTGIKALVSKEDVATLNEVLRDLEALAEKERNASQQADTEFQSAASTDQQRFQMLSTILKTLKDMKSLGLTRPVGVGAMNKLKSSQRREVMAIGKLVAAGKSSAARDKMQRLVKGMSKDQAKSTDIGALMFAVMRESYVEQMNDLKSNADKVKKFNAMKSKIRARIIGARDASSIKSLEKQLATVGNDAQLANIDLQNSLQKNQQALQMLSNVSKMLHDTTMAVLRKFDDNPGGQAPGPQERNAPSLPEEDEPIIIIDNLPALPAPTAKGGSPPDDGLPGTTAIDKALLGESLGLGAGLPTLPTATQGGVALPGGNVMQRLGDDGQRPVGVGASSKALLPAARTLPSAPTAARSLQSAPNTQGKFPSIKPTQGTQGQKVAPITKSLQGVQ